MLLTFALAGFAWLQQTDEQYYIFLVDQSTSISENGRERLEEVLTAAKESVGQSKVAFLPFASTTGDVQQQFGAEENDTAGASTEDTSQAEPKAEEVTIASAEELAAKKEVDQFRDGTNIASAIEAAAGYLPPGYVSRIVLLSDGNETILSQDSSGNLVAG